MTMNPATSYGSPNQATDFDAGVRTSAADMMYKAGSLKEQIAARKAQDAYNQKKLELDQQGLGLQADQIAKQYAMDQANLEWQKQSFQEQFGQTVKQSDIDNQFRDKQAALDNQWKTAEQTGFRDGVPTLATMQFNEQTRQFNVNATAQAAAAAEQSRQFGLNFGEGQRQFDTTAQQAAAAAALGQSNYQQNFAQQQAAANTAQANTQQSFALQQAAAAMGQSNYQQSFAQQQAAAGQAQANYQQDFGQAARQFAQNFGENQRQFNTSTVLNAPRGPADWAAYTARMRGLQSSGGLPGAVGTMFNPNAQVASFSNGGQQTGPVLSNTDLALAATGQGDPSKLQGTPWQGAFAPQSTAYSTQGSPDGASSAGAHMGSDYSESGAYSQGPSSSSGSSDPYGSPTAGAGGGGGGGGSPYGDGSSSQGDGQWSLPSIQKFRKYSPTEQQMGLGYLAENGGPTADDAQYQMQRQGPQFARSQSSRFSGM